FYGAIAALRSGGCEPRIAQKTAALVVADPGFPSLNGLSGGGSITAKLRFPPPSERRTLAEWLRVGSPLTRRMHRNTRDTLRRYYELGLIAAPPPTRVIEDVVFDYVDPAERAVYDAVTTYIERRFKELEHEKPGKGFVMTIYRRRATSSPFALEQSLAHRREGLRRVLAKRAIDEFVEADESLDPRDLGDLDGSDAIGQVSAAYPTDPGIAKAELADVEQLLGSVRALVGRDTKRDRFYAKLRQITDDGRSVLVFTEYADTIAYLRDSLQPFYGTGLGCYSGAGGERWDGSKWQTVTKDAIARALQEGQIQALVCTDAASEGLNLQAAGAAINYDLPWNPSKVEQRIGRIDRIGQQWPEIQVVNFFLKDSVDAKVYQVLRARCGLFQRFVGPMQPVLARARRMLIGEESFSVNALEALADRTAADLLGQETYVESLAAAATANPPAITRARMEEALAALTGKFGPIATRDRKGESWILTGGGIRRAVVTPRLDVLERDSSVLPLSPLIPWVGELADRLSRAGELLPLVVGACEKGAFRVAVACWVTNDRIEALSTFDDLRRRVDAWTGEYPNAARWVAAETAARQAAGQEVQRLEQQATERERAALDRQVSAARLRLRLELGRYLACLGEGTDDLNAVLYRQLSRDIASAQRLKRCLDKFGEYPSWPPVLCAELASFAEQLPDNRRRARLIGAELDAALQDPRWEAALTSPAVPPG
ncbi:MAG: helicase-related protein, partial [Chloroflexota bacterium]